VWSPYANFQQIAFTLQDLDGGGPIGAYTVDADGSNVRALSGDAPSAGPSWSPNGLRIAFATWNATGIGNAVVVRTPGEADMLIRLPDGNVVPTSTSWSPDGSVIAFGGSNGIWIGPTGGGDARSFISDAASIAWSPDRQRIAFIRTSERQAGQLPSKAKAHR
jgi:Tol biopolymer transport system component